MKAIRHSDLPVLVNKLDASRTHAGVKEGPPSRGTGPAHTADVWGERVGGLDDRMLNIHQSKLWDATIDSALAMRALNWSAETSKVGSHGFMDHRSVYVLIVNSIGVTVLAGNGSLTFIY